MIGIIIGTLLWMGVIAVVVVAIGAFVIGYRDDELKFWRTMMIIGLCFAAFCFVFAAVLHGMQPPEPPQSATEIYDVRCNVKYEVLSVTDHFTGIIVIIEASGNGSIYYLRPGIDCPVKFEKGDFFAKRCEDQEVFYEKIVLE